MEVEYMATTTIWFCSYFGDLGFKQKKVTLIFLNNQGCLSLIQNLIHHSKTKHIDIQHYYVREMVSAEMINFEYVPIVKMVINMLTKVVFRQKHMVCMEMLGLQPFKD
jgi:hypothetical protein